MEEKNNTENQEKNKPNFIPKEDIMSLPLDRKKEVISQNMIQFQPKIQKAIHNLVDFFEEAKGKGFDFVSKTQLKDVFPKKHEKVFTTSLEHLIEMKVVGTIPFKEVVLNPDSNESTIIDNTAYSLTLDANKLKEVPKQALILSISRIIALKSRLFYNPRESLFSLNDIINREDISKDFLQSAIDNVTNKEQVIEITYLLYKSNNAITEDKGYFVKNNAFEILDKAGDKFNDIYTGREEKINQNITAQYNFIIAPEKGFKLNYKFSPKEIYYIAKHVADDPDTYGKLNYLMAERAIQMYNLIPQYTIEKIEREKNSKKENLIIEEIAAAASRFFDNYKDIISETSLIDTLSQVTSKDRSLIKKALPKLSSKIRKVPYNEKDRSVLYYVSINSLVPILRSVKDINIKMEYVKLEVVVSVLEELFERVRLKKMEKNNLANMLKINPQSFEDLKREVDIARKRLSESRQKGSSEKKKGFFERIFELLFGGRGKKKTSSMDKQREITPEMKEREFYNKAVKQIMAFFNRYKRPVELKNLPNNIRTLFNYDEDEMVSFLNRLVGEQLMRKIRIKNEHIGQIEYYLPFNFLSNPKKYEEMTDQIKNREKFIDVREELLNTLMREYSTIQGKIKK
jgi:hypothetical protein